MASHRGRTLAHRGAWTYSTTIRFPFQADYTTTYDPDLTVLKDIASKCGFLTTGATSSVGDIKVNYKLKLSLKVLSLAISPS